MFKSPLPLSCPREPKSGELGKEPDEVVRRGKGLESEGLSPQRGMPVLEGGTLPLVQNADRQPAILGSGQAKARILSVGSWPTSSTLSIRSLYQANVFVLF